MKALALTVALAAILGLAIYAAMDAWAALEGTAMSVHGWIALGAGVVATVAVGAGLMFLVFYSNRHGYDDPDNKQH
jgi:hypothetical protein